VGSVGVGGVGAPGGQQWQALIRISRAAGLLIAVLAPIWVRPLSAQAPPPAQGFNPDLSVIVDFVADVSPDEPRLTEDGRRFSLRELELGLQGVVDPFFRADVFLALHGGELDIEEAYLTALALPGELQARVGRFALPMGRVNLTHRPELLTLEYPLAIRTYFGAEGYAGTGIGLSRIFAPLGFFQEIQLFLLNGVEGEGHAHDHDNGHDGHDHGDEVAGALVVLGPARSGVEQFGVMGHLRNYVDLSAATNVEIGMSWAAGTVERYRRPTPADLALSDEPADVVRSYRGQRFYGLNTVVRWRPPSRGLYRSLIWNTESFAHAGPESTVWGGFTQLQWQLGRRTYLAGRFDAVQTPGFQEVEVFGEGAERHVHWYRSSGGDPLRAASAAVTFFPSEFSRFRLSVEREWGSGFGDDSRGWRAGLQTTFSLGPHRPHAF